MTFRLRCLSELNFQTLSEGTTCDSATTCDKLSPSPDLSHMSHMSHVAPIDGVLDRDPDSVNARAREARRKWVLAALNETPTRRFATIAARPLGEAVPVMVAIRTARGIVTGELSVPADRWDEALFLKFLQEQDERCYA
jgi:hypothetical protein